jgi:hypothetical protein
MNIFLEEKGQEHNFGVAWDDTNLGQELRVE